MKYMGSKRAMLRNGLGELLARELPKSHHFVDLFAGSGVVAAHVAAGFPIPVLAFDLQEYSVVLANSVLKRRNRADWQEIWDPWIKRANSQIRRAHLRDYEKLTRKAVSEMRVWCAGQAASPITRAYGGHYFSAKQAIIFDSLRQTLPDVDPQRTIALAALVQAASMCAAAPGHTAQPFQPTPTAIRFILEAWDRDPIGIVQSCLRDISRVFAQRMGSAVRADANAVASNLRENDLAFVDPPYSGVHYSRFYHVLETIAHGDCGEVSGIGRYPDQELRPRSSYSMKKASQATLDDLLGKLSNSGVRVILTFPDHNCSNGLSGKVVRMICNKYFRVIQKTIKSRFSTLGGTSDNRGNQAGRAARQSAREMMLLLSPL